MIDSLSEPGQHDNEVRRASLQDALNNLVRQYDGKVGNIISATVGKTQAIISSREGFNMFYLNRE